MSIQKFNCGKVSEGMSSEQLNIFFPNLAYIPHLEENKTIFDFTKITQKVTKKMVDGSKLWNFVPR